MVLRFSQGYTRSHGFLITLKPAQINSIGGLRHISKHNYSPYSSNCFKPIILPDFNFSARACLFTFKSFHFTHFKIPIKYFQGSYFEAREIHYEMWA